MSNKLKVDQFLKKVQIPEVFQSRSQIRYGPSQGHYWRDTGISNTLPAEINQSEVLQLSVQYG